MSYRKSATRVAWVQLNRNGKSYPASCEREDINVGDRVEVLKPEGEYVSGVVTSIEFKHGIRKWRVAHLASEVSFHFDEVQGVLTSKRTATAPIPDLQDYNPMSQDELIEALQDEGFEAYEPRTSSWFWALIASNATSTLYVMLGRAGVVLKLYDSRRETCVDSAGKLYTDGGLLVRYSYAENDVNVNRQVLDFARRFSSNRAIPDSYLESCGVTKAALRERYLASRSARGSAA